MEAYLEYNTKEISQSECCWNKYYSHTQLGYAQTPKRPPENIWMHPVGGAQWQDCDCLIAPFPFNIQPPEDFDPSADFNICTGKGVMWYAQAELFFSYTLCHSAQEDVA